MKKHCFLLILFSLFTVSVISQGVAINNTGAKADESAMLDISSTEAGLLIPRVTLLQRNAIDSPATGLLVYQTNGVAGFYVYNGSGWELIWAGERSIDALSDGRVIGNSVYLGSSAGILDDGTNNYNVGIGTQVLNQNITGFFNVATGYQALFNNEQSRNTAIGYQSLYNNETGQSNTGLGFRSGYTNSSGSNNTLIGYGANFYNETGSYNTILGYQAGWGTSGVNKSGNVFLGYRAGYNETGSNKLYIENSNSGLPLVYGEFDNDILRIYGTLHIGNAYHFPLSDGTSGQVLSTDGSGILAWSTIGITQLNDLTDAKTGGNSVFLGSDAGADDDASDNRNSGLGIAALYSNTSGIYNSGIGYRSLYHNVSGNYNIVNGAFADYRNHEGSQNVMIGYQAGACTINHSKSGNVRIGYFAGYNDTTDNKLYIENSNSSSPLIWGNFDADSVRINGNLVVNGAFRVDDMVNDLTPFTINDDGKVGIGTISPSAPLHVADDDGVLFGGTLGLGSLPATGSGTRMVWYPAKAAFRAGHVSFTQWDDGNIGNYSVAMGSSSIASGFAATAMGWETEAKGDRATAMGRTTDAWGDRSMAFGDHTLAWGEASTAMGYYTDANGDYATSMGFESDAGGEASTAMGYQTDAGTDYATAMGYQSYASGGTSTAMGSGTTASGIVSTSMGYQTHASGIYSTSMGYETKAESHTGITIGRYNIGGGNTLGWVDTDPLFEIGNGSSTSNRNNALTVYKNGNTELDGNLDVLGEGRFESNSGGVQVVLDGTSGLNEVEFQNSGSYGAGIGYSITDDRIFLYHGGNVLVKNGNLGVGVEPSNKIDVSGGAYCTGTTWANASSRSLKENFSAVDGQFILEGLSTIRVSEWNYISDGSAIRHIGPMAEDFHVAFGLGDSNAAISTVDIAGVSVAAIQALHEENMKMKATIENLQEQIGELRRIVETIKN